MNFTREFLFPATDYAKAASQAASRNAGPEDILHEIDRIHSGVFSKLVTESSTRFPEELLEDPYDRAVDITERIGFSPNTPGYWLSVMDEFLTCVEYMERATAFLESE